MAVRIIRRTLHTIVVVLGGFLLVIGGATRFSPEAITPDLAALIRVLAPLLLGLICAAVVFEVGLESAGQADREPSRRAEPGNRQTA